MPRDCTYWQGCTRREICQLLSLWTHHNFLNAVAQRGVEHLPQTMKISRNVIAVYMLSIIQIAGRPRTLRNGALVFASQGGFACLT